jgi:hypothetical protein
VSSYRPHMTLSKTGNVIAMVAVVVVIALGIAWMFRYEPIPDLGAGVRVWDRWEHRICAVVRAAERYDFVCSDDESKPQIAAPPVGSVRVTMMRAISFAASFGITALVAVGIASMFRWRSRCEPCRLDAALGSGRDDRARPIAWTLFVTVGLATANRSSATLVSCGRRAPLSFPNR